MHHTIIFSCRGYLAPEYESAGKTSVKSDIYSLGAIIIELVTGCMRAPDENNVRMISLAFWNNDDVLYTSFNCLHCHLHTILWDGMSYLNNMFLDIYHASADNFFFGVLC
jgi:serine/threonine protein kinase